MTPTRMAVGDNGGGSGGDEEDKEDVRVQAVVVDHYMSAPLPSGVLAGLPESPCYSLAREVPVVRVFGATPGGQKTLVHVHGVSGCSEMLEPGWYMRLTIRLCVLVCPRYSRTSTSDQRTTATLPLRTRHLCACCSRRSRRTLRRLPPRNSSSRATRVATVESSDPDRPRSWPRWAFFSTLSDILHCQPA